MIFDNEIKILQAAQAGLTVKWATKLNCQNGHVTANHKFDFKKNMYTIIPPYKRGDVILVEVYQESAFSGGWIPAFFSRMANDRAGNVVVYFNTHKPDDLKIYENHCSYESSKQMREAK